MYPIPITVGYSDSPRLTRLCLRVTPMNTSCKPVTITTQLGVLIPLHLDTLQVMQSSSPKGNPTQDPA